MKRIALIGCVLLRVGYAGAVTVTIDPGMPVKPINQGIRGMAIADQQIHWGIQNTIYAALELSRGSALRGVAGGLYADLYNWRNRNNEPRPPTLEFLRWARDNDANLFITVNTRGLVVPNPDLPGKTVCYTSSPQALARLAADWVTYVNIIVPKYRKPDLITDPDHRRIMQSISWNSFFPGDQFDTLQDAVELPVRKVVYWEIGNEPTVSVANNIGVTNGFTLNPEEYYERYKLITRAMKDADPTIKVGPCIVNGDKKREHDHLKLILSDHSVHVDFIAYHPYQYMGREEQPGDIENYLKGVYDNQRGRWKKILNIVTSCGRDADSVEMVASEVNVSYWSYNDTEKEGQAAHMLGSMETVFTYARLGLTASHYWIWPAHAGDGTRYPNFKAFEMLRDTLGDRLLVSKYERPVRIHAIADSRSGATAVYALNFSHDSDSTVTLELRGMSDYLPPTARRLGAVEKTNLFSANLSAGQPGGPKSEVDWRDTTVMRRDDGHYEFNARSAEMTVVLFNKADAAASRARAAVMEESLLSE